MNTRDALPTDAEWIANLFRERWNGPFIISRGRKHDTRCLPGIIACDGTEPVGLLTYLEDRSEIEIVTVDALKQRQGIGRLLMESIFRHAERQGIQRLWLITTNDNTGAMAFYTACGFRLVAVHLDAVSRAREIKPEIPKKGFHGLSIRDEIEFERLSPTTGPERTWDGVSCLHSEALVPHTAQAGR